MEGKKSNGVTPDKVQKSLPKDKKVRKWFSEQNPKKTLLQREKGKYITNHIKI
jgi:hypothetical protein